MFMGERLDRQNVISNYYFRMKGSQVTFIVFSLFVFCVVFVYCVLGTRGKLLLYAVEYFDSTMILLRLAIKFALNQRVELDTS